MGIVDDLKERVRWAAGGIALTRPEADTIISILEAACEHCAAKADEIDDSEDETLLALFDALRDAGEEIGI